jgi:protein-S-isoprenylcysteine O-methyltransferase Ste14
VAGRDGKEAPMQLSASRAAAIAFVLTFFAVGIPFWSIPYSKLNVPDGLYGFGLVVAFAAAAALCATMKTTFRRAWLVVGLAVPAALMARVIVEGILDPTRHNLWPLALMIAAGLGLIVSCAGAVVGLVLARVLK